MNTHFSSSDVRGTFSIEPSTNLVIFECTVENIASPLTFAAAAPADKHASFTGSGLPFANAAHAFENTPTAGEVRHDHLGKFTIKFRVPNAYYVALGSVYIQPTLYLTWTTSHGQQKTLPVPVAQGIPYRKLTYPWQRSSVDFYSHLWDLPVRTQEQVLRDSAYDVKKEHTPLFWGLKPPV